MSRSTYAVEQHREEHGSLVERRYGPASPASRRQARTMRRTMYPVVANWRPTTRGIHFARRVFDRGALWPPLRGTTLHRAQLGGVPVEWTKAPRAASAEGRRVVLYLHGGGFVVGSVRTHRNLASRLSQVLAAPVASVEYRMPPEASVQGTQADALGAYRGLLDEGWDPASVIVAGDSAGGGLAAFVALAAIDQGLPTPAAVILLSPWVDLGPGGASRVANLRTEFFIGGTVLDRIARAIVPDEAERSDWRNSPINAPAELLAQLPPTLIQVGEAEVLLDDGVELARRIGEAGAAAELQRFEGQGHVVAMWIGAPEARAALRALARWVGEVLPGDRAPQPPTEATLQDATQAPAAADAVPRAFPG